jgi:hypothetical protein
MVSCTCGLLPNPANVPNSKYKAWWYSIDLKFHADDEKTQGSWIWARAPKKCAPCFRGTRNFLFIYDLENFQKTNVYLSNNVSIIWHKFSLAQISCVCGLIYVQKKNLYMKKILEYSITNLFRPFPSNFRSNSVSIKIRNYRYRDLDHLKHK